MTTAEDWSGRVGREWALRADALDGLVGPAGEAGIETLGDVNGRRLLDLGCGAGATSLHLAGAGAEVTGIDLSPDLIEKARTRDPERRCTFIQADAGTAHFEMPFDGLFSRFGAMFFEDAPAAFAHLRGQMVPGARATMVVWQEGAKNPWAYVPLQAAIPVIGEDAAQLSKSRGPGPFAWAEPETFQSVLTQGGWTDVTHDAVDRLAVMEAGTDPDPLARAALFALRIGPLARALRGVDDAVKERVADLLMEGFAPYLSGGNVQMPTRAWVITARA